MAEMHLCPLESEGASGEGASPAVNSEYMSCGSGCYF